jgi:hypothetical protein
VTLYGGPYALADSQDAFRLDQSAVDMLSTSREDRDGVLPGGR